jgi:hypothetical protein
VTRSFATTDSVTLSCVFGIKRFPDEKTSITGHRTHVKLLIPQKPEIIRRLESDDSHRGCDFMQHWTNL